MPLLLRHCLLGYHAALYENGLQRPEELPEQQYSAHALAAELQRSRTAVDLWHDLAEEKQEEGEKNGYHQEVEPLCLELHERAKDEVAEHDYGDVDQVVGYQDCGKRALGVVAQPADALVARVLVWIKLVEVGWRQAEKRYLGAAGEARQYQ